MKHVLFTCAFFFPCILFGQQYAVFVKDDTGAVLPFVHAVAKQSEVTILTNANGILIFDGEDFTDEDTLVFESLFYEKLEVPVKELKTLKEILLKSNTITLEAVIVKPVDIEKMVAKMAAFFCANYARDYAAKVTQLKSVECNGKYREFYGYQGLFASCDFMQYPYPKNVWDDKNWMGRLPSIRSRYNTHFSKVISIPKAYR